MYKRVFIYRGEIKLITPSWFTNSILIIDRDLKGTSVSLLLYISIANHPPFIQKWRLTITLFLSSWSHCGFTLTSKPGNRKGSTYTKNSKKLTDSCSPNSSTTNFCHKEFEQTCNLSCPFELFYESGHRVRFPILN